MYSPCTRYHYKIRNAVVQGILDNLITSIGNIKTNLKDMDTTIKDLLSSNPVSKMGDNVMYFEEKQRGIRDEVDKMSEELRDAKKGILGLADDVDELRTQLERQEAAACRYRVYENKRLGAINNDLKAIMQHFNIPPPGGNERGW